MEKQKLNLIAAGVLTVLSLNASAALTIYSNEVEKAEDATNLGNYEFNQKGLSSEEATVVSGFGKSMPLNLSLQIIIPTDWKVDLNQAAMNMPVDWMGKSTWPYVLENLAQDNNLLVTIDWERRTVNVFSKEAEEILIAEKLEKIKVSEAKKLALVEEAEKVSKEAELIRARVLIEQKRLSEEKAKLSKARDYARLETSLLEDFLENNPGQTTTMTKLFNNSSVHPLDRKESTFVKMMANKTLKEHQEAWYYLREGVSLSENLIEWGKANDWKVIWKAKNDFMIVDRIELKGSLLESIETAISLYKNSDEPITADALTKNKVIIIKDFNYDAK